MLVQHWTFVALVSVWRVKCRLFSGRRLEGKLLPLELCNVNLDSLVWPLFKASLFAEEFVVECSGARSLSMELVLAPSRAKCVTALSRNQ